MGSKNSKQAKKTPPSFPSTFCKWVQTPELHPTTSSSQSFDSKQQKLKAVYKKGIRFICNLLTNHTRTAQTRSGRSMGLLLGAVSTSKSSQQDLVSKMH
jgi:hypothetical protein